MSIKYEVFHSDEMSDVVWEGATWLFIQGTRLEGIDFPMPDYATRATIKWMKKRYLVPESVRKSPGTCESNMFCIRAVVDGEIAGQAFYHRFGSSVGNVCWVAQIIVLKEYRERGIARSILSTLRRDDDDLYGITSANPAAILAASTAWGNNIEKIDLDFISKNARAAMDASPGSSVRRAALAGHIFGHSKARGNLVAGVRKLTTTEQAEPQAALKIIQKEYDWPLGDLPKGHEFLLVMPRKKPYARAT